MSAACVLRGVLFGSGLAALFAVLGCTNDPTLQGVSTTGANLVFHQIDREGRPGLKTVYLPWASHATFNAGVPSTDTGTVAPMVQSFVTGTAGRSSAIASYVSALLTPDALIADLSQTASTASYLGWETSGQLATSCVGAAPNAFGGRGPQDDVVIAMLGLAFGNLATSTVLKAPTPNVGASPPADDGKEQNGTNGTPQLTTDNVGCAGKTFTFAQFPYLAAPY